MDGNLLDDMYSLDPATGVWTTMYRSDNAWQKNAHAVSCLVGKRLIVASAKQEGSKLDELRILEFGKIAEQHALIKDMEKRIVKELKALEAFNKESLLNLALDPTKEANEEKQREVLLKVKGCIYQVCSPGPHTRVPIPTHTELCPHHAIAKSAQRSWRHATYGYTHILHVCSPDQIHRLDSGLGDAFTESVASRA